jgi:hypothetical protein
MLQRLIELRPLAYHTCSALNFESIRRLRALKSADELLRGTPHEALLNVRRESSTVVTLNSGPIEVRDNLPLRPGSLALEAGCSLARFLLLLNQRVYFWPGNSLGPRNPGLAHFEHYKGEGVVHILRAPLTALVQANPDRELEVTFCNSGSARHHGGRPVIRGPSTFQPVTQACGPASQVKELCFVGSASLPQSTEWSASLAGPWQAL